MRAEREAGRGGLPRPLEALAAAAGLVVLSPLLALAAIAVALSSRGPVLFRQQRVGRGGRPFEMLKFRTMRVGGGGPGVTAAGDERVTAVGRRLRRLKLDELPELVNVLRGELALVGPRPEVPRFVDLGDPRWRAVLEERPGITHPVTLRLTDEEGLIAAAGGDPERFYREELLPWKLAGYREYAAARTWRSDLAVLAATAGALVGRRCYARVELDEVRARTAADEGRHD